MKSFKEFKNKGIYISWRLNRICAEQLKDWATLQNIDNVYTPDHMHITVAYSRKFFEFEPSQETKIKCKPIGFDYLGDNKDILVLRVKSKELQDEFNEYIASGASFDYSTYKPHVTISNNTSVDIKTLHVPKFKIVLDYQRIEPLDLDKKA